MRDKTYRWFIALTRGGTAANQSLFEFLDYDETDMHKDCDCFDRDNLSIKRNLYEVTREQLRTIWDSAASLKMSFETFVQEGSGKIRFFNPNTKKAKEKKPDMLASVH
jgi:hypothetical protein